MSIWNYANPTLFMSLSKRILPTTTVVTLVLIITGTCWGFFLTRRESCFRKSNNESNDKIYLANSSRQYWLSVSNKCETISDTINIKVLDKLILDLGPDLEICEFPITIDVFNENAKYIWQDNSENNFLTIQDSSIIWVNIYNECESLKDTLKIDYFCGCNFFIPSGFSPNKDGQNDLFGAIIDSRCQIKKFKMIIYNRWG